MKTLAMFATLAMFSTPADAQDLRTWNAAGHDHVTKLRDLPEGARADFRMIQAGNALTLTGVGASGLVVPTAGISLFVAPVPLAIGTPMLLAGQLRSIKRLKDRGIHVNRTGVILGGVTSGLGFVGAGMALGNLASADPNLNVFVTGAIVGATLHGLSLIPFHAQSRALRRGWTIAMQREEREETDSELLSPRNKLTVLPALDPVQRKVGITMVW